MADTRTALPLPTPSPASSSSLLQPNSFNHRTPSLSLSSRDKQGSEASAANGNGSGSAPDRRQLSQTASSDGATDATTVAPDLNGFDNASSTSHGTRPHHRRDESQASQLSQLSSSHASTVSHTLHDSHPASLVSTPQAARSISPRLSPRPLQQPLQPPLSRRLSTDRRVRSEALPETKRHLSITGRRPSVLTGGYESSTDEEEREHRHGSGSQGERLRGASAGHLAGVPHLNGQPNGSDSLLGPARSHLTATGGRRRAHSLMSPPNVEFSPPISPARRPSRLRPPSSGSPYPRTGSGTGSPGGTLRATSDGFHHPLAHASSSRVTSTRSVRTEDEQRRRKRSSSKMPAEPKRNPLAESLGLGIAPGQAVLSPDQIENLLGDVDVSNAMKMMAKPPRRQSSVIEGQNWQPQSPPLVARSPPMTAKPFLVSAPPPLTNGDWEGRHRGSSVSSSIATPTPLRNVTPAAPSRRQRTFSVSDSDGGHVPFTHHVPPTQPQPESDIDEGDETVPAAPVETEPPAEMEQLPPPIVTTATPVSDTKGKDKEKDKKRISGLFSLRKKPHRTLSPPPTTSPSRHLAPSPRHDPEAGALREREAEMRLAEQERREDELSQERRYRAMMQIHAHPYSQRRAQRVATHFDAYYSLIYQGLEHPPKVNPLAVIRWAKREEEQKELKHKWEESQREGAGLPPLASPSAYPMGIHSGSSGGFGDSNRFLASPGIARSSLSRSTTNLPVASNGWHYTVQDIQNYRACNGKTDYFIAPTPEVAEDRSISPEPHGDGLQWDGTTEAHGIPPSVDSSNVDERNGTAAIASPSLPSLLGSGDQAVESPPSRATSIDTGSKRPPFLNHRTHQSTGGIPPKPLRVLRAPFERAKDTLSRRNVTSPNAHVHSPASEPEDDSREPQTRKWTHEPSSAASLGRHISTPHLRDIHHTASSVHSQHGQSLRDRNPLRRRRHQDTPGTSDDEHHRVRGLIARGARGTMDMLSRGNRPPSAESPNVSRTMELRNLEQVFAREKLTREHQESKVRKDELEMQAEEKIRRAEDDIYAEREELLDATRHRLEQAELADTQMEYTISHFLTQLDQVRMVFRSAADVDIAFNGLDNLRKPVRQAAFHDDDEEADSLAPLRMDSDRGYFSASGRPRTRPRRQSTLPPVSLPSFAYGLTAWPRRSTLDPTLGITTDPIHRVELTCDKARNTLTSMGEERASATRTMQDMVGTITGFIEQKDLVRAWTKAANDRLAQLRSEKASILLKIQGGVRPRMWRATDVATDLLARNIMSLFSYGIRIGRALTWVRTFDTAWFAWAIILSLGAMAAMFYAYGGES